MPCNLSAFIMGFILKEYTTVTFSWSDGLTNDILNVNKLKEMIDEVIRLEITPNPRYKDKYIVAMTDEEKAFNEITSAAFGSYQYVYFRPQYQRANSQQNERVFRDCKFQPIAV